MTCRRGVTGYKINLQVDVSEIAADVGNPPNESNASSPECTAVEYSRSACTHQLSHLQECYYSNFRNKQANGTIEVCITPQNTETDQEPLDRGELLANGLQSGLSIVPVEVSDACIEQLKPFACLYLFPLAVFSNGSSLGPTARSCMVIRDNLCTDVWKFIEDHGKDFGLGDILPTCEELEEKHIDLLQSCSG